MKRLRLSLLIGVLLVSMAWSGEMKKMPIQVLIVDGFSNHDWRHTTACIKAILEQHGGFNISVSTFPKEVDAWNPDFKSFDAVIQTCNDIGGGPQWPRRVESALEEYVAEGGGLYVFHSANNAFPHWPAYNQMIGLGWRDKDFGWAISIDADETVVRIPAGEGEKTSHGKRVDALLTRLGDHPIHAGLPRRWIAADIEIYRYARGPAENLTVLSYAKDEKTGLNFPIEWTTTYGKGHVYNSTFGHVWKDQEEPQGIRCGGFQALVPRIVQWLAGSAVHAGVPSGFPTSEAARLNSYPLEK